MGKLTKIICLLATAFVVCGFAYKQYKLYSIPTEYRMFVEHVHSGDRFNIVVGQYYDSEINDSWDEWQTKQKQINHKLFENGRSLQVGDKIVIITKVRVEK